MSSVWNRMSLGLKLTITLILMQSFASLGGGVLLAKWIERIWVHDLDVQSDTQMDALEELISVKGGQISLNTESELVREMDQDRQIFIYLRNDGASTVFASKGPRDVVRSKLMGSILQLSSPALAARDLEMPTTIMVEGSPWRLLRERIKRPMAAAGGELGFVASMVPLSKRMGNLKRHIFMASMALALLTGLGAALIVSLSTRNLRRFSKDMSLIHPLKLSWKEDIIPQSAEEKLLFSSFKKMLQSMADSQLSQKIFIANASHELRTPVAAIYSALELTQSRPRDREFLQSTCESLFETAKGLKHLITALLDLSLLEGEGPGPLVSCDVEAMLLQLLPVWENLEMAKNKGIKIHFKNSTEGGAWVMANHHLLKVAFSNVVENAVKYSRQEGEIDLILTAGDGPHELRLRVIDRGIGMSELELRSLGKVFFRADSSRSDPTSFGLGLALVRKVIEDGLGGKLTVTSTPQMGTEVVMSIPS